MFSPRKNIIYNSIFLKNRKVFNLLFFLLLANISAFIFEEVPRIIFKYVFKHPTMEHIWEVSGGLAGVAFWYTAIFSIFYLVFINKPVKYAVIAGVIFGMLAETFIFKTMNIFSFFLFPVLYGYMFYLPFRIMKMILKRYDTNQVRLK